ncbi:MAG: hypothetical protein K6F14_08235 [Clostridiales bacterium]|nr:hypothetical protein [Clostridiales bacterium]
MKKRSDKLINISKSTFISVLVLLFLLIVASTVLTYVIPKGEFGVTIVDGKEETDYLQYNQLPDESGLPVWKGILAPILVIGSGDGISLIMLSVFLLVIAGAFQAMNDDGGIKVIVQRIIRKFRNSRFLLLSIIALVFMLFGSLLGLFEEMLTLLPIIAILSVRLGYDSFTGFLVSIVACGFGFSSAITNPFTVLFASKIIDVNPMTNVWYRIVIFVVMYALIEFAIFLYTKKISKYPEKSFTYESDANLRNSGIEEDEVTNERKILITHLVFFAVILVVIISFSALDSLRDYTVVALTVAFLIGGILSSLISTGFDFKSSMKSFGKGVLSALPSIAFIFMASSIKYIFVEGKILPTITNTINLLTQNNSPYVLAAILFGIILVLEFFISSSTAKAVFVMSILGVLNLGITKEMLVLIYTFADGYTNLLFPTSPVLLIGLSMIGFSYFKWVKKSWPFFVITFILVLGFIALGILIY